MNRTRILLVFVSILVPQFLQSQSFARDTAVVNLEKFLSSTDYKAIAEEVLCNSNITIETLKKIDNIFITTDQNEHDRNLARWIHSKYGCIRRNILHIHKIKNDKDLLLFLIFCTSRAGYYYTRYYITTLLGSAFPPKEEIMEKITVINEKSSEAREIHLCKRKYSLREWGHWVASGEFIGDALAYIILKPLLPLPPFR